MTHSRVSTVSHAEHSREKKKRFVRGESLGKGDVSALRVVRDKSDLIVLEEISSQWYDGKVPVGSWGPHKAVV